LSIGFIIDLLSYSLEYFWFSSKHFSAQVESRVHLKLINGEKKLNKIIE